MAKYDDKTARGWPLPNKDNRLLDDVERLREALKLIDETITGVEEHEDSIEGRQDSLDTRMDTILEGATDDAEILDARVDAGDTVHPNLGHNIRNLHRLILGLGDDIQYETDEFQGLLQQYSELVHTQLQGEINATEASQRRKQEIRNEAATRDEQDAGLQYQADALAHSDMQTAINNSREREALRTNLKQESDSRRNEDAFLQDEVDALGVAQISQAINIKALNEKRRADAQSMQATDEELRRDLTAESQTRQATDDELRDGLTAETFSRGNRDDVLQYQADMLGLSQIESVLASRNEHIARLNAENAELQQRAENDAGLQAQINSLANAVLSSAANLREAITRRKDDLTREILTRSENDSELQRQSDDNATANIRNALNLQHESEQRRKSLSKTQRQLNERLEQCDYLQTQIDGLISAVLQVNTNLHAVIEARRNALAQESQTRQEQNAALQEQVDTNAQSAINNAVNIHREAEQRRKELAGTNEHVEEVSDDLRAESLVRSDHDDSLQAQADNLAWGLIRAVIDAVHRHTSRIDALDRETQSRTEQERALQTQSDDLARASLKQSLNLTHEAEKRRKDVAGLGGRLDVQEQQGAYHQAEIGELINAVLKLAVNFHEGLARHKEALRQEATTRRDEATAQQVQADINAEAIIRNALNIAREAQERREGFSRTQKQIDVQGEDSDYLKAQIDGLISAVVREAVNFHEALERRKIALDHEAQSRRNNDEALQRQSDASTEANLRNALNLHEALDRRKIVLDHETQSRIAQDETLQEQADTTSAAILRLAVNLSNEAEKRRELEQALASINSPVDWSKSSSLAISEPRCAVVNFTGLKSMPTTKTADIPAFMEFWDMAGNYFRKPIVCSAQGSSSLGYVKKNVKFDLLNDDGSEFDLKIGGWVVQDGFHLKAYYTDFFRGIGVTSYKFWDDIMRYNGLDNDRPYKRVMIDSAGINPSGTSLNNPDDLTLQLDTGALCHPDGFPCIVYLNGTFYGVYSWQIKKQRKNYHMDKSTVEHIHLDGTLSTGNFWNGTINWTAFEIRNPNKLYTMDGKKYDGDAPRELIDETSDKYDSGDKNHVRSAKVKKYIQGLVSGFAELKRLYTVYRTSPSAETLAAVKAKYEELFDWENMRDYLIFSDIIKNSDGFAKNWQWTTYDGVKWYVNAYDLDMSYGGHWQGIQITAPLTNHITTSTALPVYYVALLYKSELETRYKELREAGIISVNNILSKLADWTARIGVSNYELEYERWPNSPCILNYTDSIYRVKRWLEVEIANMDKVYHYSLDEAPQPEAASLEELEAEACTRQSEDAGIIEQIRLLSLAGTQEALNTLQAHERRKREAVQETQTRSQNDDGLQIQINELADASMRQVINDLESRRRIIEDINNIKQILDSVYDALVDTGTMTYRGAKVATSNEIRDMLSDVMSGSHDGAVSESEIPEDLKKDIATREEITEMLDEVFPNRS